MKLLCTFASRERVHLTSPEDIRETELCLSLCEVSSDGYRRCCRGNRKAPRRHGESKQQHNTTRTLPLPPPYFSYNLDTPIFRLFRKHNVRPRTH